MINQDSLEKTSHLAFGEQFIRPAYGSYCFAHLPATIRRLFGVANGQCLPPEAMPDDGPYERVLFFFVDSLGWQFIEQHADGHPFLVEMLRGGVISRLTSMFPSTTSAHVTCMNTGLPVGASGVYEWFYFEPQVDQVIAPLLFSPAGERGRDLLLQQGIRAENLFPAETLYLELGEVGVESFVFTSQEYANSAYSQHTNRGATIVPFVTWAEGLVELEVLLERQKARTYVYLYMAGVDAVGHVRGPGSRHVENEILALLDQMERFLRRQSARKTSQPSTLLILTADHGQAPTDPATIFYLNQRFPGFEMNFQRTKSGKPILFGGSARDLFLYVKPERLEEVQGLLAGELSGRGEVHRTEDLIRQGFFGPRPVSRRLETRLGNLVLLPYAGESVGWYEKDKYEMKYYGHHGGLSPQEMFIPLIAYPLC